MNFIESYKIPLTETKCLRIVYADVDFVLFSSLIKTHRLLSKAINHKKTNYMFNAFVFCLRIVYASLSLYIDEYHQVKTTYNLEKGNISHKLSFPYRTLQTIRDKCPLNNLFTQKLQIISNGIVCFIFISNH